MTGAKGYNKKVVDDTEKHEFQSVVSRMMVEEIPRVGIQICIKRGSKVIHIPSFRRSRRDYKNIKNSTFAARRSVLKCSGIDGLFEPLPCPFWGHG